MTTTKKTIKQILRRPSPHWVGDGFNVYPVFHDKAFTNEMSPFLMFDYAAPKNFPVTKKKLGVGEHPHRGFETVTIAFQGEVEHGDSMGNRGVIFPGDTQWMSAARGIVHEEFHSRDFASRGGIFEFCQLWVNLPAKDKMNPPRYQPIKYEETPKAPLRSLGSETETNTCDLGEGYVRVIAGSYFDTKGPAKTYTAVHMLDIHIGGTDKTYIYDATPGHNVIVFVRKGSILVEGSPVGPQSVALMNLAGSRVAIQATEPDSDVLILAGEPIDEPIAARGPFVMNTQRELQQAMQDFQSGKFGQ